MCHNPKHHPAPRGFTLIELLVVIAVIAVLMAVIIPALGAARRVAKRTRCSANLKQIALSWNLYLDDNDGRFLQDDRINLKQTNMTFGGWQGQYYEKRRQLPPRPLNQYVGYPVQCTNKEETLVFSCPADRGGGEMPLHPEFHTKLYDYRGNSYQTNVFLVGQDACGKFADHSAEFDINQISPRLYKQNRKKVYHPSRLLLVGDWGWFNQWQFNHRIEEQRDLAEWHQRSEHYNMAFLDGHTDFIAIQKGIYVSDTYHVLPFHDLFDMAIEVQASAPEFP